MLGLIAAITQDTGNHFKATTDAKLAEMSLSEQLTQLMDAQPPYPSEGHLIEIAKNYRFWDYFIAFIVFLLSLCCVAKYSPKNIFWPFVAVSACWMFYISSEIIDRCWGRYYMQKAQAEFDEHASKVREVLTDWVSESEGKPFDEVFLGVLNQHWNLLNDSGYGDSLGMSFSSHQKLGAHISVYRFTQDRE